MAISSPSQPIYVVDFISDLTTYGAVFTQNSHIHCLENNLLYSYQNGLLYANSIPFTTGSTIAVVSANTVVATTISASTMISGSTNLYQIFQTLGGSGGTVNSVSVSSNIINNGSSSNPIITLTQSPSVNNFTVSGTSSEHAVSATTLSAGTINSGATNLYSIFATIGSGGGGSSGVQSVNANGNLFTGGTAANPIIEFAVSPSFNSLSVSGTSYINIITATTISSTTLQSGIIISGSTNLYSIFETEAQVLAISLLNF